MSKQIPYASGDWSAEWSAFFFVIPSSLWLSSNQRYRHWSIKARRVQGLRELARVTAIHHRVKLPEAKHRVWAHVGYASSAKADPNNAHDTTKALLDGLIGDERKPGGFILPGDDSRFIEGPHHVRAEERAPIGVHTIELVFEVME